MHGTPRIGEGVRVPWGRDTLDGEVIEVPGANRVVVAVPVGGTSGEVLERVTVTVHVEDVGELPRWRIVASQPGLSKPGADAPTAWYIDAQRNGEQVRVEVRLSATATRSRGRLPKETRTAIDTEGRSAVEKFSYRLRLPRVIVAGTGGVFELSQ